jgi:anti-anti-sigma regulatory factor
MLKIQRTVDGQRIVFILSGRIEGEQVAELQHLFALETDEVSLVLDLHEVELVDRETVQFLARCEVEGATLVHCPPYIRAWIERERDQL